MAQENENMATYMELVEWLAENKAVTKVAFPGDNYLYSNTIMITDDVAHDRIVKGHVMVRRPDEREFHDPTIEYLGLLPFTDDISVPEIPELENGNPNLAEQENVSPTTPDGRLLSKAIDAYTRMESVSIDFSSLGVRLDDAHPFIILTKRDMQDAVRVGVHGSTGWDVYEAKPIIPPELRARRLCLVRETGDGRFLAVQGDFNAMRDS